MGRKKIQISRITDERNRQVTFNKRKFGVMKKAYELSVLCDCEIALIIFSSSNKLYQYASTDMDKVLLKYTEYNEPHESLTNKNIIEALNKKEHKNGACSPDSVEDTADYQLTPTTERKYTKIDEQFQLLMQQKNILSANNNRIDPIDYPSLSVPMGNFNNESSLLQTSPHMGQNSVSPRPSSSEAESGYPSGSMLEMSNGYPNSTSPGLGDSSSPGPSPMAPNIQLKIGDDSTKITSTVACPGPARSNLRVMIPNQHDENHPPPNATSLNTPVVSLQTPIISSYPGLFSDMNSGNDLSLGSLNWPSLQSHSSNLHLGVPSTSPVTSSPSPNSVHIKSEPNSPPRPDHHSLARILSHTAHATSLAPQHLVPGNALSISSTAGMGRDYSDGPVSKRPRESWGT